MSNTTVMLIIASVWKCSTILELKHSYGKKALVIHENPLSNTTVLLNIARCLEIFNTILALKHSYGKKALKIQENPLSNSAVILNIAKCQVLFYCYYYIDIFY